MRFPRHFNGVWGLICRNLLITSNGYLRKQHCDLRKSNGVTNVSAIDSTAHRLKSVNLTDFTNYRTVSIQHALPNLDGHMSNAKAARSTLPRRKRGPLSFDLDKFILDLFDEKEGVAFHLNGNYLCFDEQQAVELLHIANVVERARLARGELKIKMPKEFLVLHFRQRQEGWTASRSRAPDQRLG